MLGYEHTGYIAENKNGERIPFGYRHLRAKRRARQDYLAGYTDKKRTTTIETADCIVAKEDYVVWLEGEKAHRRIVAAESDYINDFREERYTIMELE